MHSGPTAIPNPTQILAQPKHLMESNQAKPGLLCNPEASQRTLYPYVTSVVAQKYKDGILMAADMGD
ncbi:hypothetical protein GBA52_021023 [Prunus armeniaca]|nr:hypothetical protein GBA52_021023 [Prunus armeniaca]